MVHAAAFAPAGAAARLPLLLLYVAAAAAGDIKISAGKTISVFAGPKDTVANVKGRVKNVLRLEAHQDLSLVGGKTGGVSNETPLSEIEQESNLRLVVRVRFHVFFQDSDKCSK